MEDCFYLVNLCFMKLFKAWKLFFLLLSMNNVNAIEGSLWKSIEQTIETGTSLGINPHNNVSCSTLENGALINQVLKNIVLVMRDGQTRYRWCISY